MRSSNGGSGIRLMGKPASCARAPGTRRSSPYVAPGQAAKGGHDLRIQVGRREQRVAHGQAFGNEGVPWIVGGVEDREDRSINHREARDASRTSRTAATDSSAVTPVPRGGE